MFIHKIRERWRCLGSNHLRILRGMALVSAFVLIGKFAGAAKEVAVAWRYGVSDTVDAYLFVFNLVNWPVNVWTGVLTVVLIPLAARIRNESPGELARFRAQILGMALISGCLLTALGVFGLPVLLKSDWIGLTESTVAIALELSPGLSLLALLGVLIGMYSTWTMSVGRHANTLLEGLPALIILLGVLLTGGIEPLLWGTLAGTVVQLACLTAPFASKGELDRPDFLFSSSWWLPFRQGFIVMMVGQLMMSLTSIIDLFFAARLGEGAISTFGYANRILALALGLGATAVSRATLPVFSQAKFEGDIVNKLAIQWAGLIMGVGLIGLFSGWLLASWGVKLLFERGAFTSQDTEVVAAVFKYGLLQMPFYFASLVFVSLHASKGNYRIIMVSGFLGLLVKIVSGFMLIDALHLEGLMLSTGLVYLFNLFFLAWRRGSK